MHNLPRICLLHTGGTIGMVKNADGIVRPCEDPADLPGLAPELAEVADIDFVPLFNKDSSNISPTDWTTLARAVFDRRHLGYDGFVITHGTDTMHFSATALAFALGSNLPFPVVFTGSTAIPAVIYGDARTNLIRAVHAALSNLSEVVIAFGNHLFRGCRTRKKDYQSAEPFHSPGVLPLGEFAPEILLRGHAKRRPGPEDAPADFELQPVFAAGIFPVTLTPGLEPDFLAPIIAIDDCKGVLIQAFGAGNIPNWPPHALGNQIRYATERGKPVIITTHHSAGSPYALGIEALQAGAIPTGNTTPSAAIVKFRWVLAGIEKEFKNTGVAPDEKVHLTRERMGMCYVSEMD
ncbi:MAG: hypothetical protein HKP13_03925 [Gammaproteobacteria bacterium]|nr:hypothetical protein [Gammaproteobacteria bacterium]